LVSLSDRYLAQYPSLEVLNNHLYVKVVDEKSATISGNPDNIGLEADHRGINKFGSRADPNYLKVLEKLRRLVDNAPAILKRGTAASHEGYR
jgi:hypothetical protein